jgi:hypothetical protein
MSIPRRLGACAAGAAVVIAVSANVPAPASGASDYLPAAKAPVKPGNYRSKATHGHFVLSSQRKQVVPIEGRKYHFQDFLFLTWTNPDGYRCGMSAFEFVVISPPHLPNGAAAGLLEGASGPPGASAPTFFFHGRFRYRGKAKSKAKRRPNSIKITATCNGVTSTRLYTWSSP